MRLRAIQKFLIIALVIMFIISVIAVYATGESVFAAVLWSFMNIIGASFPVNLMLIDEQNLLIFFVEAMDIAGKLIVTIILTTIFYQMLEKINLKEKIASTRLRNISGHVVITPANGIAIETAKKLSKQRIDFVVIDQKPSVVNRLIDQGIFAISGDPTQVETLDRAKLRRASRLVLLDEDDVNNTMIAVEAKAMNSKIKITSRMKRQDDIARMTRAGISSLLLPEVAQADEIAAFLDKGAD